MSRKPETGQPWDQFLTLLAPFHDRAAATARRLSRSVEDGDDLFQEAVIRACSRFHTLRDPARFRPWFFTVLLNVHRNRAQRYFWRRFISLEAKLDEGWMPVGENGSDRETERQRAAGVSKALASLPALQREAVVLFEMEDYALEEIAGLQNSSIAAVKTRVSRGRERLRRWYEEVHPDEAARLRFSKSCDGLVAPEKGS